MRLATSTNMEFSPLYGDFDADTKRALALLNKQQDSK